MKKRLLPIFFLILLTFGLALPVSAAENSIDDGAQLLTPNQPTKARDTTFRRKNKSLCLYCDHK